MRCSYGRSGGGGTISRSLGGQGGTGAGDGNLSAGDGADGQDALANQGGGGGRNANGGAGGSGIVVLRFCMLDTAPVLRLRMLNTAPALPRVAGMGVAPAEVFTKAKVSKSIVYPAEPAVTGEVGAQVISFGGVDVNVPNYYTATKSGTIVTLALNKKAAPEIADEEETPGFQVVDGKVRIHLTNVKSGLYYTVLSAPSPDAKEWAPCGKPGLGQSDFEYDAPSTTRFFKVSVRDEAE